jgi:hypothetical protein
MAPNAVIDYDALAKQNGAIASVSPIDYDALAAKNGATASLPPGPPTGNAGTAERPLITPLPGEDFADTMKRAAAMGKNVTPQQIQSATQEAKRQVPTVLGAAAVSGPALMGLGATLPAHVSETVGGGLLGDVAAGATGAAGLNMLQQPLQGQNPFSGQGLKQAGEAATIGGVAGGAFSIGGSLLRSVVGPFRSVPAAKLNVFPPAGELQPAVANTPKEILDYAGSKGIPLTPGQATNAPIAKTVEAVGERSLAGMQDLTEAREAARMKLAENVKSIADAADPQGLGISEEQAGQSLQQSARNAQDAAHDAASAAYQKLPQQFMDAPVDINGVRGKYFQQLKQAEVSLANRNPAVAAQIRGALEQGANLGTPDVTQEGVPFMRPELKVSDLLKVRSDAIQDGNSLARAGAPNEVQATYRGLASDVDNLVEQQANQMGVTQQWRDANAGWRDYRAKFNTPSSPLYQIANQTDPANVTRTLVNNGSAANVQLMQSAGMNDGLQALKRQIVTDIANRNFAVKPDGLGGYSDSFLKQLFGPAQTKELYINGELARRMGFQMNPSGTSNVLLGTEQVMTPSRFSIPAGAAKLSMPRPAQSFLPPSNVPTGAASAAGLLDDLATVGSQAAQKRDPETGQFISQ